MSGDIVSIAGSLLIGLLIEAVFAWPARIHAVVGHPVTWLGALIGRLDAWLNNDRGTDFQRRCWGMLAAGFTILLAGFIGWAIAAVLPQGIAGVILAGLIVWPLLAARSLYDHVAAVAEPLGKGDIGEARQAVAMIVGRDPEQLDEAGVGRAALESLAENASDGVVAPLFWGLLLGLPGIAAYKAINTLDSMIGHRTPRHEAFGWFAARIDDVANWVPARLTGLFFVVVGGRFFEAFKCMARDASQHRSPNAGWPEAAMAGSLGVRMSGPRVYEDHIAEEPWLNVEGGEVTPTALRQGLVVFVRAMVVAAVALALLALI